MRSGVAVLALLLMSLALGPASDAVIVHPYMCERWLREDTAGDVDGVEEVKPSGIPPSSQSSAVSLSRGNGALSSASGVEGRADDAQTVRRLFDGERLRLARELRRRSQSDVGGDVGVSAAATSQYEKGESRPPEETLVLLARSLAVPMRFFAFRPSDADVRVPAFFSRLRSTSAADRKRARALTLFVRWFTLAIERRVRLPDLTIPRIPVPRDADQGRSRRSPPQCADDGDWTPAQCLTLCGCQSGMGIVVTRFKVGSRDMDAFSVPYDDRPVD